MGAPLSCFLFAFLLLSSTAHAGLKFYPPKHADSPIVGTPVVTRDYAIAVSRSGGVMAINMVSGEQAFPYSLNEETSIAPAMGNKYLILGADSGRIEAIDLAAGRLAWKYPAEKKTTATRGAVGSTGAADAPSSSGQAAAGNSTLVSIAASGGKVFASFSDRLVALDETTGKDVWGRGGVGGGALSTGGGLYLASGESIFAYSYDGTLLWSRRVGSTFGTRVGIAPEKNLVFVATTGGQVMSVDSKSGKVYWVYEVPGWAMSTPRLVGANVVFGTNNNEVVAVNADGGTLAWKAKTGGPVWAQPLAIGDAGGQIAIVGANDGYVYAFDGIDGHQVWRYQTSDWTYGAATFDGKEIVLGSEDGVLWALSVSPMCTISNLQNGQLVGEKFDIAGQAFAFRGVRNIEVKVGALSYPPLAGSDRWNMTIDATSLPEGPVDIYCHAVDNGNLRETDAGPKVHVIKSLKAPKQAMSLTMNGIVEPKGLVTIYVRDAGGNDLDGVSMVMGDSVTVIKSPYEMAAPSSDGDYKVEVRKSGFDAASGTFSVRTNMAPAFLIVAIVLLGLAIVAVVVSKVVLKK